MRLRYSTAVKNGGLRQPRDPAVEMSLRCAAAPCGGERPQGLGRILVGQACGKQPRRVQHTVKFLRQPFGEIGRFKICDPDLQRTLLDHHRVDGAVIVNESRRTCSATSGEDRAAARYTTEPWVSIEESEQTSRDTTKNEILDIEVPRRQRGLELSCQGDEMSAAALDFFGEGQTEVVCFRRSEMLVVEREMGDCVPCDVVDDVHFDPERNENQTYIVGRVCTVETGSAQHEPVVWVVPASDHEVRHRAAGREVESVERLT